MAVLVLLAAAAGAGFVAADLGALLHRRSHGGGHVGLARHTAVLVGMRVGDIADLRGPRLDGFGRLGHLLLRLDAHRHQLARHLHLHHVKQLREQLEGLALVFLLRVLLRITAQMDALAQVIQRGKVLAPMAVHRLQQHHAHEGRELLGTHRLELAVEQCVGRGHHLVDDVVVNDGLAGFHVGGQRQFDLPVLLQHLLQAGNVPLLFKALRRHMAAHHLGHRAAPQVCDLRVQRACFEDLVALLVDDLALVVADVVVFEQLLADVEVARLDLALRTFDAAADDAGLDGLTFGHLQLVHDRAHAVTGEDAHQRIVQRQVEAARPRVTLSAGAAAQLVVDAPALVPLGGDDAQSAVGRDLVVQALPFVLQFLDASRLLIGRHSLIGLDHLHLLLDVAAEHDVGAAAGHVGGDGDHAGPTGLGHDLGLFLVLLGVEHLVRQLGLGQQLGDQLGVLDRGGAHQHRLAARVAVADVLDDGVVLLLRRLVDQVVVVLADRRLVRRNDHRLQPVDLLELEGFGVGRAGHAAKLAVHAEIVLEGHRRQRLVLVLDLHAFLGLDRLVQPVGPAPPGHQPAGELVDDDHFAVLHHVVLVAVVQLVGTQRGIHMVHQRDIGRVVQAGAFDQQPRLGQQAFGFLVAVFGQEHLVALFVHREVARVDHAFASARVGFTDLLLQLGHDGVDAHVQVGVVLGLAADDQRRARLVDQDRIDLVDDCVVEAARHAVCDLVDHVVAQVVEAELVVGAVGDVSQIGSLLLVALHAGYVDAHAQPQEAIQAPHPFGVASRQVVVDGDHMHTLAGERVQVHRQGGRQGLAFTRAHLGDLAFMQRDAADQLHVEVAHLEHALAALAHHGKGLGQQLFERLALRQALAEFIGLGAQRVVVQSLELRLQLIDLLRGAPVGLQQAVIATAENLVQYLGQHAALGLRWTRRPSTRCCRASARTAFGHHAKGRRQVRPAFRFASSLEAAAVEEFSTRTAALRSATALSRCCGLCRRRRRRGTREEARRVLRNAGHQHLEVKVRPRRSAGGADLGDDLTPPHDVVKLFLITNLSKV